MSTTIAYRYLHKDGGCGEVHTLDFAGTGTGWPNDCAKVILGKTGHQRPRQGFTCRKVNVSPDGRPQFLYVDHNRTLSFWVTA